MAVKRLRFRGVTDLGHDAFAHFAQGVAVWGLVKGTSWPGALRTCRNTRSPQISARYGGSCVGLEVPAACTFLVASMLCLQLSVTRSPACACRRTAMQCRFELVQTLEYSTRQQETHNLQNAALDRRIIRHRNGSIAYPTFSN